MKSFGLACNALTKGKQGGTMKNIKGLFILLGLMLAPFIAHAQGPLILTATQSVPNIIPLRHINILNNPTVPGTFRVTANRPVPVKIDVIFTIKTNPAG